MTKMDINQRGLSFEEVIKLKKIYGRNEIVEKFDSPLKIFLKKFYSPIPLMIEFAMILSAVAGRWEDFTIIAILLGINIFVEFIQQQKSHKAIQALKEIVSPSSLVLRDGKFETIDSKDLVPGDIVKLINGDIVPADAKLFSGGYLIVDQSSITGESLPVKKEKKGVLYASSLVQGGSALVRITAIGKDSSVGKNAKLIAEATRKKISHFEKAIFGISKFLIIFSVILIAVILTVLTLRGDTFSESIRLVLVLGIASIPVALPTVLSVTMAIGAKSLAKKRAVITNAQSMENLAGVDILCVDKTGTLTKNEIEVDSPKVYGEFTVKELIEYAFLAIDSGHKSPLENAVYKFVSRKGVEDYISPYKIKKFIPFNSVNKITEALIEKDGKTFTIIMGAPQVIMKKIEQKEALEFAKDNKDYAEKGYRSLAIAKKDSKGIFVVGILPLLDSLRDDAIPVIKYIESKGIKIKMVTGDNTAIATFIAKILSLGSHIIDSETLREKYFLKKKQKSVAKINVFAEVTPDDKYHIVENLQKNGHIVAMTGDGSNDAPALKKVDVGIAVSGATPIAKSAADIVLLSSGLNVIQEAIKYSRMIFARMQSYATFRISETIRIILFITFSVLLFNYTPISAIMIILLALLNDIPVMSIAYDNAPISEKPMRWRLNEMLFVSIVLGVAGVVSSFGLLYWLQTKGYAIAIIQTIIFLKLDVAGHSTLYVTRTGRKHFWQHPFPSWKFFIPAFSSRIIGTLIVVYGFFMEPIGWSTVFYIWTYSIFWFLLNDQIKILAYKIIDKYNLYKKTKHKQLLTS